MTGEWFTETISQLQVQLEVYNSYALWLQQLYNYDSLFPESLVCFTSSQEKDNVWHFAKEYAYANI